jgi:hypothetical protein
VKYDDASWHYGGTFPKGSPQEFGGTHIALFMKWCFAQGWAGELHGEEEPEDTQKVIDGSLSATEFLFKYCDGKLTNEDLSDEGNIFAGQYYGRDGLYLRDYAKHFRNLMYVAPEGAHDFAKFSAIVESRRRSGILTSAMLNGKPWWRRW